MRETPRCFIRRFSANYDWLYENPEAEYGLQYKRLIPFAEDWMKRNQYYVGELVDERKDLFASDRELEALAMTILRAGKVPGYIRKEIKKLQERDGVSMDEAIEMTCCKQEKRSRFYKAAENRDYIQTFPQVYTTEYLSHMFA